MFGLSFDHQCIIFGRLLTSCTLDGTIIKTTLESMVQLRVCNNICLTTFVPLAIAASQSMSRQPLQIKLTHLICLLKREYYQKRTLKTMVPFGLNFEESAQQLYYQYLEHLYFNRTWYVLKTKNFGYVTNGCNLFKFKHVFYLLSFLLLWFLSSLSLFLWRLLLSLFLLIFLFTVIIYFHHYFYRYYSYFSVHYSYCYYSYF